MTETAMSSAAIVGEGHAAADTVQQAIDAQRRRRFRYVMTFVLRRVVGAVLVVWGCVTATFFGLLLAPGDTALLLAGENATDEQVELIRDQWGLDQSWLSQYLSYLGRLLQGDWGYSYSRKVPVAELIDGKLWPTVQLGLTAFVVALVLAVTVAVLSASSSRPVRAVIDVIELVFASVPSFWLALLLLFAFSFTLHWFPVSGNQGIASLVLPVLTLALPTSALLSQVIRGELDRTADEPFGLTVRARGASRLRFLWTHGVRHSWGPAVTISGTVLGSLLGGAVITEQVFGRQGLGQVTVAAVQVQDMPVVLAVAIISAIVFVVTSTLVDISYLIIDPRLRSIQ